ncbi:MAG: MMPL family transporter [Alphaproteobacteria bacterium]|nr:MMPL family transporter [Alphaproteobacteria bacterium]
MLQSLVVAIVRVSTRLAPLVVVLGLLLAVGATHYAVHHFDINTDINSLISANTDWRKRDQQFDRAFNRDAMVLGVVEAATPEMAATAANALVERLKDDRTNFLSMQQLGKGAFFEKNGLLFAPQAEVAEITGQLEAAAPLVETLAADPSIRGLTAALQLGGAGILRGQVTLDAAARPFNYIAGTVEGVLRQEQGAFSWRVLATGDGSDSDRRAFIEFRPVLEYNTLEPGKGASDAIRRAARELDFAGRYQARVRLTGPVQITNEENATVQEGALVNGIGTIVVVLVILWLALRSAKIIFAVFVNLFVGLALTTAAGLMMVGKLNLLSVAFAVLFIGLGVDFGIQYSVRYRSERHQLDDLSEALVLAARRSAVPLSLAAMATAAGFLCFMPTDYSGIAELGQIAGVGMLVAFLSSITLLPALLRLLNPPGEKEPVGYAFLAPLDRLLETHRIPIVVGTLALVVLGLPLLYFMKFDFNPMNLRNPAAESISTFLDLRKDPQLGANAITVLTTSPQEVEKVAARLLKVKEVAEVRSLESFVPADQDAKLKLIGKAAAVLKPALKPAEIEAPPSDQENIEGLRLAAATLRKVAGEGQGSAGATAAGRLADALERLAAASPATRDQAERVFITPMKILFAEIANLLEASPVTLESLPEELVGAWKSRDGLLRVDALPRGDPNDNDTLRQFAAAVLAAEPTAIGGPVSILKSGDTVVEAFVHAGIYALLVISLLLWLTLRRFSDVLMTLVPLLVAGAVTLEICVLVGLPLNFANIVAFPLMLGIGVAFKIYYVVAWRGGHTNLLQTSLTRAIFFSALTTATAFGSLWLSSHPGTSSMGKLLALSLVTTLAAVLLFQPALMGKPRDVGD